MVKLIKVIFIVSAFAECITMHYKALLNVILNVHLLKHIDFWCGSVARVNNFMAAQSQQ